MSPLSYVIRVTVTTSAQDSMDLDIKRNSPLRLALNLQRHSPRLPVIWMQKFFSILHKREEAKEWNQTI